MICWVCRDWFWYYNLRKKVNKTLCKPNRGIKRREKDRSALNKTRTKNYGLRSTGWGINTLAHNFNFCILALFVKWTGENFLRVNNSCSSSSWPLHAWCAEKLDSTCFCNVSTSYRTARRIMHLLNDSISTDCLSSNSWVAVLNVTEKESWQSIGNYCLRLHFVLLFAESKFLWVFISREFAVWFI